MTPAVHSRASERQLCTARVGDLLLGLDVLSIQEVQSSNDVTVIPQSAPAISGLINLRGQIATAIDLRVVFGVTPRPDSDLIQIVVRHRGEPVSLLVDEIGEVMTLSDEIFETPPETVDTLTRELVTGAYKLENELLLTLDVDRVIATSSPGAVSGQ